MILIWECRGITCWKLHQGHLFSANQLNKSPLENPRFCDTSRMEFDRWSACYALVEMSELCDDQIGLLCESKSLRLQIMEMMGDDPNSIDVW